MKPLVLQSGQVAQSGAQLAYAQSGPATIQAVAVSPGWQVIGAVYFDAIPNSVTLEAILLVTDVALTGKVQLFDTVGNAAVAGSTVTTSSTVDDRQVSGNLAGVMTAGRVYQIRAECTGASGETDAAIVRNAAVR